LVDVFVSYKQEEREAVQIIASSLADLKLDVWFDTKLRAGGSFDEEIATALQAAKAVPVCWTHAAIQSDGCAPKPPKDGRETGWSLVSCSPLSA
jgi:hypothetical protein